MDNEKRCVSGLFVTVCVYAPLAGKMAENIEFEDCGMHLTPELPRSSIWAVAGYWHTLEAFLERFAFFSFDSTATAPLRAAMSRSPWSHDRCQMVAYARNWCGGPATRYRVVGSQVHTPI